MSKFPENLLPENFVQGMMVYDDHYLGDSNENLRIVIPVTFEDGNGSIEIKMIVDTGGVCILDPKIFNQLNITQKGIPAPKTLYRGDEIKGRYYKLPIKLMAEEGTGIEVEATILIPEIGPKTEWGHPNILGFKGFLENMHFAVNPDNQCFYFGSLGSDY